MKKINIFTILNNPTNIVIKKIEVKDARVRELSIDIANEIIRLKL